MLFFNHSKYPAGKLKIKKVINVSITFYMLIMIPNTLPFYFYWKIVIIYYYNAIITITFIIQTNKVKPISKET